VPPAFQPFNSHSCFIPQLTIRLTRFDHRGIFTLPRRHQHEWRLQHRIHEPRTRLEIVDCGTVSAFLKKRCVRYHLRRFVDVVAQQKPKSEDALSQNIKNSPHDNFRVHANAMSEGRCGKNTGQCQLATTSTMVADIRTLDKEPKGVEKHPRKS
jgi:hypothetical protein